MTKSTIEIVQSMEAALQRAETDLSPWFHDDFVWSANYGCGVKYGMAEFEKNWHLPFRAAFHDRDFRTDLWMEDGDWAACHGHCAATHGGIFMGIEPTGKRIKIPYIDFWRIEDGKIAENRVSVDYPSVLAQLGVDVFNGEGWEVFDRGERTPPGVNTA